MIAPDPKYVIVQTDRPGLPLVPVLLPCFAEHSLAAKIGTPVSAGRCVIEDAGVRVYGDSFGLNLHSRPEDAQILAVWFGKRPQPSGRPVSEVPCNP